jgi:hypothetical protein
MYQSFQMIQKNQQYLIDQMILNFLMFQKILVGQFYLQ